MNNLAVAWLMVLSAAVGLSVGMAWPEVEDPAHRAANCALRVLLIEEQRKAIDLQAEYIRLLEGG